METSYTEPINPNGTRVGWIGIGIMGTSMASRVLSAGYAITVYARAPEKALCLQNLGVHLANSPADVARVSDVVFTIVGHPSDVRSVVLGDEGILSNLPNGGVIVDTTSSHPLLARETATAARMRSFWAVDAPVSMVMELFGERMIEREILSLVGLLSILLRIWGWVWMVRQRREWCCLVQHC